MWTDGWVDLRVGLSIAYLMLLKLTSMQNAKSYVEHFVNKISLVLHSHIFLSFFILESGLCSLNFVSEQSYGRSMGDSSGHKLEDIIGSHITPRKRATLNHRKRIPTMTRTVAHSQPIEDHTGRPLAAGAPFFVSRVNGKLLSSGIL